MTKISIQESQELHKRLDEWLADPLNRVDPWPVRMVHFAAHCRDQWHDASKEMPKYRGQIYLVCCPVNNHTKIVMEADLPHREDSGFRRLAGDHGEISNVTHWRELPSPPQEKQA